MGLKQIELVPISSLGPTALIPAGKDELNKFFQVTRADTVSTIKCVVPASLSPILLAFYGSVSSDAGTTATVTVTITNNTGVISTGTVDVKANGATTAIIQMTNLPLIEQLPSNGDYRISVTYAETGTASTVGGPWRVRVIYV